MQYDNNGADIYILSSAIGFEERKCTPETHMHSRDPEAE